MCDVESGVVEQIGIADLIQLAVHSRPGNLHLFSVVDQFEHFGGVRSDDGGKGHCGLSLIILERKQDLLDRADLLSSLEELEGKGRDFVPEETEEVNFFLRKDIEGRKLDSLETHVCEESGVEDVLQEKLGRSRELIDAGIAEVIGIDDELVVVDLDQRGVCVSVGLEEIKRDFASLFELHLGGEREVG